MPPNTKVFSANGNGKDNRNGIAPAATECPARLPEPLQGTTVRLILCRHGETDLNAQRILQGSGVNPPLNGNGCNQARRLAARLAAEPIDWIISSKLQRAIQTADAAAQFHPDAKRDIMPELNEICFGVFEGVKDPQLGEVFDAWNSGDFDYAPQGGESPMQVVNRAARKVFEIISAARAMPPRDESSAVRTVAIFVHGRLLRILLAWLLHHSLHYMNSLAHHNCNINVVDVLPLAAGSEQPGSDDDAHAISAAVAGHPPAHALAALAGEDLDAFAAAYHARQTRSVHYMQPAQLPRSAEVLAASRAQALGDPRDGAVAIAWPAAAVEKVHPGVVGADPVNAGAPANVACVLVARALNETRHLVGMHDECDS